MSAAAIAAVAYCFGAGLIPFNFSFHQGEETAVESSNVQIPTVEAKLIQTHTVEYVEETVIEKEYVNVIRHVPVELRNFTSLEELTQWLQDEYDLTTIRFQQGDTVIDCDDYAIEMQQKALTDGYIISFEIISIGEYNELFSTPLPEGQSLHAINLSIVGNSVYYIEPQTGEVVHAAYLD